MSVCCGKQRSDNFCPNCGQSSVQGLNALLQQVRNEERLLRDRLDRQKAAGREVNKGKEATCLKWKAWGDGLEDALRRLKELDETE